MALPEDFNKIYGSTATGGLTPINDVNYAKGWEFVGSNPPTKNDFSYLQQVSDLKSQYLYKAIGGDSGAPAIGIPFFWPSSVMPNIVMTEWADMVFLKFNDATFSATTYPKLALVYPDLKLPEMRGEFIRVWDDGRGVDIGRALLSAQGDAIRNITGTVSAAGQNEPLSYEESVSVTGAFTKTIANFYGINAASYLNEALESLSIDASKVVPVASENRPRNIAFNLLVRAK